jgi:hypothetical protein
METIMFTLGVLSIILIALAALVIYGTVTVLKLKTETTEIWRRMHENHRDAHLHYDRKFEDTQRDVNMIEATMHNQIQYASTQNNSYTDSRIDKLIDTYFMVKDAEQNTKKIIKG